MHINKSIFEAFPVLKTKRLTLRSLAPEDAHAIYQMRINDQVNRFIARPQIPSLEAAEELVSKTVNMYDTQQGIGWAGVLRNSGDIIGTCGFNGIDYYNNRAEIGGELSTEFWGKHIAVEAVTEIVRFGMQEMNLHTIEAKVQPDNRGAIFLLSALGFKKEAHFRERMFFKGEYLDMVVYTLLKGEETFPQE